MDAVLDADHARRPDGDPPRDPRHRQGRRRNRAARVRPHHLSAARQPLPDLHAALDDFPARRLQRRQLRLRRRPGELDARAGDARHTQRLRDRSPAPGRGGRDVGAAAGDPAGDRPDAQAPHHGGAAMSTIAAGARVTFFALLFGSLTSFAIGRMRIRHGWLVSNAALLTYVIPASFLAIPFYRIMQNYGLANNPWSVIAALVAFATPYAIFVFQE